MTEGPCPDIAIVMAAGEGTRWGWHLDVPKHLIVIDGETLLHRTVRLLKEHVDEVWVVAQDDDAYREHDGQTLAIEPLDSDIDKFYSSRSLWEGRHALLVYGDCYLTEEAVATMCGPQQGGWRLFCRPEASALTGCEYGECFGFSLAPTSTFRFRHTCEWLAGMFTLGQIDRVGGWEVYRALMDYPLKEHRYDNHWAVHIDDWTEDFDVPEDYERWMRNRKAVL